MSTLWITESADWPVPYLMESCRDAGEQIRGVYWLSPEDGRRPLGRMIQIGRRAAGRDYPLRIKVISPRLLMELAQAPEDVVIVPELNLLALYAIASKLFRRRKVVALIEGDYGYLGRTGTVSFKVVFRRLLAPLIDVFVANSDAAKAYLIDTLKVPYNKIVVGWWLAGLPPNLRSQVPPRVDIMPNGAVRFLCAGQLIPRKGIDLLIEAVARYREETGPCSLWIVGDGPERASLAELARRLDVEDAITFLGTVSHEHFKGALEACDVFVFPTLQDLVGRVAVEALTVGVPIVISPLSGATGTIVQDGVNGIVADPRDSQGLADAMRRAADPETLPHLRAGARRTGEHLTPDMAAKVILQATSLARGRALRRD